MVYSWFLWLTRVRVHRVKRTRTRRGSFIEYYFHYTGSNASPSMNKSTDFFFFARRNSLLHLHSSITFTFTFTMSKRKLTETGMHPNNPYFNKPPNFVALAQLYPSLAPLLVLSPFLLHSQFLMYKENE